MASSQSVKPEGVNTFHGGQRESVLVRGLSPLATGLGINVTLGMSWPRSNVNVKTYQTHFASTDGGLTDQIMISPRLSDPREITAALFEALADLVAGPKANNKVREQARNRLGLKDGKPTPKLSKLLKESVAAMSDLPTLHQSITPPKRETTRMVKCSCDNVADHVTKSGDDKATAFIVRLSAAQIERVRKANKGKVPCMICAKPMTVESQATDAMEEAA